MAQPSYRTETVPRQAVICQALTKSFGDKDNRVMALRGVNLVVRQGEMMMLVGPSGCGKTTLISIVAGILRPDGGSCTVLDTDVAKLSADKAVAFRAKNVGFIFQSFNLLPALTVTENVAIPLIINGVARPVALRRAQAILAEVGLGERTQAMPLQLSGGQQQRVAIARALVHEPQLIVCDEPTSALDHETGEQIMALMRKAVHERGATMVIVTHDNRIFPYADRIAKMDDGHIVAIADEPNSK
ncbi:MAG: ABC transporter ATP-binding protein [Alphaproteobacteria bacterium]|nr:ABC transporter ATP-binding protein [Alphaproteobacteria bacterium]